MTISNVINNWVVAACKLPFKISNDIIQDEDANGACLRYDPAPAAERRYNDGSRLVSWSLSYYIRCLNAAEARAYALDIINRLDGVTLTDPETQTKIEIEAQTLPQFISKDDKNYTTYSAAIVATYLISTNVEKETK